MTEVLSFALLYLILCVAVAGAGKLIYFTIQPGQIFGGWQKILAKIEPTQEFWYKSLGGCFTCMRQRWAELTYLGLIVFYWHVNGNWITQPIPGATLTIFVNIILYVNFCCLVFFFGSLIEVKTPKNISTSYPGEDVIRTGLKIKKDENDDLQ